MFYQDIDEIRLKAEKELGDAAHPVREQWLAHPLTRWLLLTLKGDQLEIVEEWKAGGYSDEGAYSVDVALGMARALDDVENAIRSVAREDDEQD